MKQLLSNDYASRYSGYRSKNGFTIVELLIVIVVVAILAAITVVAYNGIQDRAKNTSTIQAVSQVIKVANSYVLGSGQLLTTGQYCMTQENVCTDSSSNPVTSDNSAAIISRLQPYGTLPASVPLPAGIRSSYAADRTVDGTLFRVFVVYYLKGTNTNCGHRAITGSGLIWQTSTTGYTSSSGGQTYCIVPIQDPQNI